MRPFGYAALRKLETLGRPVRSREWLEDMGEGSQMKSYISRADFGLLRRWTASITRCRCNSRKQRGCMNVIDAGLPPHFVRKNSVKFWDDLGLILAYDHLVI